MAASVSMGSVAALSGATSLSRGRLSRLGYGASSSSSISVMSNVKRGASFSVKAQSAETETSAGTAINPGIRKEEDKVVDTVIASEIDKPLVAYCRCWRSEKFPLCDGAHAKFNKATGDNVGPLLVKK